jgi:hypothetical protein
MTTAQPASHFPRAASAVSFFSQRSLSCADLFELDEQGLNGTEEALGDLSTTDTSEAGDQHGGQAEDPAIIESSSRNDLRRIHTMETFSWQGYSMQQQLVKNQTLDRAEPPNQGPQGQINLAQTPAYPAAYQQERQSHWGRERRDLPPSQQAWTPGEWPCETWPAVSGSPLLGPGHTPPMPPHASPNYARQAQPEPAAYLVQSPANAEKFQQPWYAPAPESLDLGLLGQAAFRPQDQQEVPTKQQPSLVPVPVPVMLGPNGQMIPVPMGNGMGVLPPQSLAGQPPQGIPALPQTDMGQQMVFLRPNGGAMGGAQGMQLFGFVNVPPPAPEAPKKQHVAKEPHTEANTNFGDDITLMLRNLPNKINQPKLLSRLQSYRGKIDFLYLPTDFENKCNLGYAFINFVDGAAAARFKAEFNDKKLPGCRRSHKVLAVQPARVQGVSANVRRFRNSSVMGVLSEEEKPMLFKDGVQIPFPMPDGPLPPVGPRYPRDGEPSA